MNFTPITITLPEIPNRLSNYCVQTGKTYPLGEMSQEHPLALALGGNDREFLIPGQTIFNNLLGRRIEEKVGRDPIIMHGRRDADARGHHTSHKPVPVFKHVRMIDPKDKSIPILDHPTDFKLELRPNPRVTHKRSGNQLESSIFRTHAAVTQFCRPDEEMLRLTVKVLLGVGWRLFLERFETAINCDDLRYALNPANVLMNPSRGDMRFLWETQELVKKNGAYIHALKVMSVRPKRSTVMLCEHQGRLEFVLTCLGYFVGALQVPTRGPLMSPLTADGQRIVIILERKGYGAEVGPAQPVAEVNSTCLDKPR